MSVIVVMAGVEEMQEQEGWVNHHGKRLERRGECAAENDRENAERKQRAVRENIEERVQKRRGRENAG